MRPPLSRSTHQKDDVNQELKKGSWDEEEDRKLMDHISKHGPGNWQSLPERAGLNRCGKSCRLRWINYLRPGLKKGNFTPEEDQKIIKLHSEVGNKWSLIATYLEGRTDNEIKNYWNTKLSKRLFNSGIDPTTHEPISADLTRLLDHNRSSHIIIYNNPILPLDNNPYSSIRPIHEYIHTHGALQQLIDNALTHLNPTFNGGPESNLLGPSYGFDPPPHRDLNALSNSQASSSINGVEYVGSNNETLLFYDGYQENDGMINMGSTVTATTPNMSNEEHNGQLPGLVTLSTPVQVSSDHAFSNDNNDQEFFLSGHTTDFVDAGDAMKMNYDDMWGTEIRDDETTTGSFFLNDNHVFDGSFLDDPRS